MMCFYRARVHSYAMPETRPPGSSATYLLPVVRAVQKVGIPFPRVLSEFEELLHSSLRGKHTG